MLFSYEKLVSIVTKYFVKMKILSLFIMMDINWLAPL